MKAQTELNSRSLDYVTNLDPRFQPTYYGIPSLKAEMRVGFSKTSERGFNLILFSKSEQKMQYGESTVSFEVVGAPPPPGPVSFGDYVVPMPRFLVVGKKREDVITQVAADKKIDQKVYANTRDNILVLRFERREPGEPTKYLVIWPGQKVNQAFDYWHTIAVIHVEETIGSDGKSVWDYPADPETESTQKRESIFEFPPKDNKGLLAVPGNPEKMLLKDLAQLVVNLGDVVMNVNLIMN